MWWRNKKNPTVTPGEWREVSEAITRANLSLVESRSKAAVADSQLCEYKRADPFGAQLFEAMKGREV